MLSHPLSAVPWGVTSCTMSHDTCRPLPPPSPAHRSPCTLCAFGASVVWLSGLGPGPASASRTTIHRPTPGAGEAGSLRKQSKSREKALFFVGRSLRGAGAPLPAPPLQQRNKTAAIFRFVSNSPSDPGVGSPVREAFVRALMSRGRLSGQLAPISARGGASPGWSSDKEKAKTMRTMPRLPDARFPGAAPTLEGSPIGRREWASGHFLPCRTHWHLPGPVSQRRLPRMRGLPGMGSSYYTNLMWWEALESSRSKNESQLCPLQLCGLRPQFPYL